VAADPKRLINLYLLINCENFSLPKFSSAPSSLARNRSLGSFKACRREKENRIFSRVPNAKSSARRK